MADGFLPFLTEFQVNEIVLCAFIHEDDGAAVETFNVITLDLCDVKTIDDCIVVHGG